MPTARLFLLPLASVSAICLSSIANAQEREVWACQEVASAGLLWENNQWQLRRYNLETYLLTIDGEHSSWKRDNGSERSAICKEFYLYTSCLDSLLGVQLLVLNKENGLAGFSTLSGTFNSPETDGYRDTPIVSALNCTKF